MQTKKQNFLATAKDAEKAAADAVTSELKEGWLKVVKGYRELADRTSD